MRNRLIILFLFFVITFICVGASRVFSQDNGGQITIEAKKIEYQLPYPGILPDHPLYFVKSVRDNLIIFFTRDFLQKAQLYLLLSDKKAAMAQKLTEKGKWAMASEQALESEQEFDRILTLIKDSKQQGVSPPEDLTLKINLSNQKHKEIIEQILKGSPQGQKKLSEEALKLNTQIEKKLSSL